MHGNVQQSGFHYDSDEGSNSSADIIIGSIDPLGIRKARQPRPASKLDIPNGSVDEPAIVDFTKHEAVRIRYSSACGSIHEGLYKLHKTPSNGGCEGLELLQVRTEAEPSHHHPRPEIDSESEPVSEPDDDICEQSPSPPPGRDDTFSVDDVERSTTPQVTELVDDKGWRVAIRQYQLDLYRAACRRNVIAYLDTGSGKTFISVLLIRDIARRIAREVAEGLPKKSIFFLVPKKVLVFQQSEVLRQFTDLTVSEYSGDRLNEDVWDRFTWERKLTEKDVSVMTPQILLNLLRRQFVTIHQIALIVFDECHHARKKAPYNCIMLEFYHPAKKARQPVPKIFGMTASLVTKKRSTEEVCNSFNELEANLDSMIMTASRETVQQHATSANELDVPYAVNTTQKEFPTTFHTLERASVRMTIANRLSMQHHYRKGRRGNGWQMDNKKQKGPLDLQIRQIGNVQHVVTVMGLLSGCYAMTEIADVWHEKEKKVLGSWNFPSAKANSADLSFLDERFSRHQNLRHENLGNLAEVQYHCLCDISVAILAGLLNSEERDVIELFRKSIKGRVQSVRQVKLAMSRMRSSLELSPLNDIVLQTTSSDLNCPPDPGASLLTSHRMQQLLRVLSFEKSRIEESELSEWRGMIFVQQTLMAIALEHVLSLTPELSFFKCQSLTGHNGNITAAAMEDHHQRRIVDMFRKGRVNLLICTSVAEEGLDITQCSMVVRFDLPFTEASYIQSRGRARKPGSSYFMFVNYDDPDEMALVDNIRFAEQCMKEFASFRQQRESIDPDEDIISGTMDAFEEISQREMNAIVSKDGDEQSAASHTAPEMIHRYVVQLPQDAYCQLTPHLIFRSRGPQHTQEYQYQLTLPLNAAIAQPILGEWCSSKQAAKISACYVACLELRALGELNQRFYPISHREQAETRRKKIRVNVELLALETPIDPEALKPEHARRKESMDFGPCGVDGNREPIILHLTVVRLNRHIDPNSGSFVLLTLTKLDSLAFFDLFTETGDVRVDFLDCGEVLVDPEKLRLLKKYHLAVLEALYFKTKLFTAVCRENKTDLGSEIDEDIEYLPEQLKQHEDKIPYINTSWYLICPVQTAPSSSSMETEDFRSEENEETAEAHIDWNTVHEVTNRLDCLHRPDIRQFHGGVKSLKYGDILISPYNTAAYKFVGVRSDLDLNSAFPSEPDKQFYDPSVTKEYKGSYIPNRSGRQEFATFAEYYREGRNFQDIDEDQPLLECIGFKQLSILKRAKNLINPSWRQSVETEQIEDAPDDWNAAVHLVPQLMAVYPLNYTFWKSLSCIVAICWKVESMVKVKELQDELFSEQIERSLVAPDIALLLESVTSKSCQESFTYERLEFIGDAVLKYVASLYCYFKHPQSHEGVLTTERVSFISNRHLAQTALNLGLQKYIRTVQLGDHPWRPAGCQFFDAYWLKMGKPLNKGNAWFGGRTQKASHENQMHQSKICHLTIKQVADVVEALMGACLVKGDLPCVCALMERIGIFESDATPFLTLLQDDHKPNRWLQTVSESMKPELEGLEEVDHMRCRVFEHGRDIASLEQALGYRFECPSFALEALTHCSWPHSDPPCYQRLEYLGDAVLDFMIVTHYYRTYEDLDPGSLTILRSASVNNDRLAATAVKTELYRFIMHFSAYLQSHVSEYVSAFSGTDDKGAPKVLGDIVESLIGATYLDLHGDFDKTWEIWSPLLQPLYTPETVPVHPVVELTNYCMSKGLQLEFTSTNTSTELDTHDELVGVQPSDAEDDDDYWEMEKRVGKQALTQFEGGQKSTRTIVQVKVDGKLVGEGEGSHAKAAKRQAAVVALQCRPWDLN